MAYNNFFEQYADYVVKRDLLSPTQITLRSQKGIILSTVLGQCEDIVGEFGFFDLDDAAERGLSDFIDPTSRGQSRVFRVWREQVMAACSMYLSTITAPLADSTAIQASIDALLKKIPPLDLQLQTPV